LIHFNELNAIFIFSINFIFALKLLKDPYQIRPDKKAMKFFEFK